MSYHLQLLLSLAITVGQFSRPHVPVRLQLLVDAPMLLLCCYKLSISLTLMAPKSKPLPLQSHVSGIVTRKELKIQLWCIVPLTSQRMLQNSDCMTRTHDQSSIRTTLVMNILIHFLDTSKLTVPKQMKFQCGNCH